MAIRDYWVYQKRQVMTPWALYIVKEYDKRKYNESVVIDYTFYHENVENPTHSISFVGLHYDTIAGYADEIAAKIAEYTAIDNQDYEQVKHAIEDIILHD